MFDPSLSIVAAQYALFNDETVPEALSIVNADLGTNFVAEAWEVMSA